MARLAEEVGLVGGDRVDQVLEFLVVATGAQDHRDIGVETVAAEVAGAAAQPSFAHHALVRRQAYAADGLDLAGELGEARVGQRA